MSQTSVSLYSQAFLVEGQLADSGNKEVVSGLAESTAIPMGKYVRRGTDADNQVKLPGAAVDVTTVANVGGIVLADQAREQNPSAATTIPVGGACSVLRKGRVAVKTEETVAAGAAVYVRYAAGGNGVGSFGGTAGTSERAVLAGAIWAKGASAGAFGVIEINLPA